MSIVIGVLGLSLLIFFHELGHFLVAKAAGVGVNTFSLGFGPRLWGFDYKGTDCRISAIPLGGYVRMVGEDPSDELAAEDIPRSFSHKPLKWRIAIVAAGPVANVVFAVLAYYLVLVAWGNPALTPKVGDIIPGEPAAIAGIQKDDVIKTINGQSIVTWNDLLDMVRNSGGKPLNLTVDRQGKIVTIAGLEPQQVMAKDALGADTKVYRIGIKASPEVIIQEIGLGQSLGMALEKTWQATENIINSVIYMIQRKLSMENLGGPILIAQVAGVAAKHSMASFLEFMALISINLAILNLLPIPVLDGGHLFFFLIEAVRRKPVRVVTRERAQQAGLAILLMFMAFVFYNDIARLVTGASQ
ncbi:RIP metalloprotease RseP [Dethiosulfatarculus sandiegensis]|uniref:Zinc metalloprotease n=1 Tax=Dethiosulfatarculus sandiegensis TaxID=1429043 RepID=A0A0D2HNE0_9BACT|nr:RIP metalloprotease RseP [Dethiosulfatarculus sandiegensis]KIX12053.1 zinc metalloprotease [Dethiosulfatarculus sandiegensis]